MTFEDQQRAAEVSFLALTIWREARGESITCKRGVAFSVLNRVARPKWWGTNLQDVLFKKWQYSSLTDPRDRQLTTWPRRDDPVWLECLQVAWEVVEGTAENPVPHADSYFDISISAPKWATSKMFVRQIGRLRFFNVDLDTETEDMP